MRERPQRSCIGCRTVRDKKDLVRIVRTADEQFVLDPRGKTPGRGAYVCPTPECLAKARKRKGFDRAFRQAVPATALVVLDDQFQEYLRAHPAPGSSAGQVERSVEAGGGG